MYLSVITSYREGMKRYIIVVLTIITLLLSNIVCYANPLSLICSPNECSYYSDEHKLGVTNLNKTIYSDAELIVEEISSGEVYNKVKSYFDGEIKMYDIKMKKAGEWLGVETGGFTNVAFYDGGISSIFKTADIYHVDAETNIIDLQAFRYEDQSFNMAEITSFGVFVVTDTKIKDESILFVPTPTPSLIPTNGPIETITPVSLGDINTDDVIDANDALCILKYAAKVISLPETIVANGDINCDTIIDAEDALEILKIAAKIQ